MADNSNAKATKKANDKKAAEGRAAKKRFEKTKERVWRYEKHNESKLIIFRSTNNWWKMGGVSALAYKNVLAPRLEKEPVLRDDTDFFSVFSDGIISVPDIGALKSDMEKLGLKISNETEEWISYELGWKVSKSDLKRWREEEKEKRDRMVRMLMPENAEPKLWVELMNLARIAYENVRKETPAFRDCYGVEMLKTVDTLVRGYLQFSKGVVQKKKLYDTIFNVLEDLRVMMLIIIELRAWNMSAQGRFTAQMEKVQQLAEEKLGK